MMRFGHGNPIFSSVPEHPPVETPMAKGATAMPAKKPTELTDRKNRSITDYRVAQRCADFYDNC